MEIKSGKELYMLFQEWDKTPQRKKALSDGFYVTAGVRMEAMTGEKQSKINLQGRIEEVRWDDMGGGVFRAYCIIS